jgi:hypothetical protein
MRFSSRVSLLAVCCLTALAAGAGVSVAKPGVRAEGVITVSCRDANLREPNGTQQRVILGVVSVPPLYQAQIRHDHQDGWAYSNKAGIAVQAGNRPVRVSVPKAWRKRVAISFGVGGPLSEERFEACSPPPTYWNGYVGGFSVSAPSCVPLVIQVGNQSRTVRFGIGRRCR